MTDVQKFKVNQIIYWKNKISNIKSFLRSTNNVKTDNAFLEKSYKVKFFGVSVKLYTRNINLDEEMFLMFFQWLGEYKEHLQSLVDNSDAELVSIAEAIRTEEITKEGLNDKERF